MAKEMHGALDLLARARLKAVEILGTYKVESLIGDATDRIRKIIEEEDRKFRHEAGSGQGGKS